jgi:hypothetical protein
MTITRNRFVLIASAFLLSLILVGVITFASFLWTDKLDSERLNETMRLGDIVVEKLELYKADRGVYPPTLDVLVREGYAESIPDPVWGAKYWSYGILHESDGENFALFAYEHPSRAYRSGKYPALYNYGDGWVYDH